MLRSLTLYPYLVDVKVGQTFGEPHPKKRRAICMLENGPDATVNVDVLKPAPIKVPTVGRIRISRKSGVKNSFADKGAGTSDIAVARSL